MTSSRILFAAVAVVFTLAACGRQNVDSSAADTMAPAMAPAPEAMDTAMRVGPSVKTSAKRSSRDFSGKMRIAVSDTGAILLDGIPTHVPSDAIITVSNGTHHVKCHGREMVVEVDYHSDPPVSVDCRAR